MELEEIPGVGKVTAEKLRKAGIMSVEELAILTSDEVAFLAGIDEAFAHRIVAAALEMKMGGTTATPALELSRKRLEEPRLTTGVDGLDEVLGGGLLPGSYEFAGEFGSGKTMFAHQLSVTVQLSGARGGWGGAVVYIDTEDSFDSERVSRIARRFGLEEEGVLRNIVVYKPINVDHLETLVRKDVVRRIVAENVRLVVVDSIIALYRAELSGRQFLQRRQQRINYLLDLLRRASVLNRPFWLVITNQVVDVPLNFGPVVRVPAGGNIVAHFANYRFFLRRTKRGGLLEVLDGPLPRGTSVEYVFTEEGVV